MQESIIIKLVKYFLENPYQEFYLRELARKLKLSPFSIKKYADILIKEKIILEERKANLRYLKANMNNLFFSHLKILNNIYILSNSGVIEYLIKEIPNTSSITLFGSAAKSLDDKNSDIDILVIGKEKQIDLGKFENGLKKSINLHILSWSEWNQKAKNDSAFYFDVIGSGIKLYGELPLIKWK